MTNKSNSISMPYDKAAKRTLVPIILGDMKSEITRYLADDLKKVSSWGIAPWVREIALEPAIFLRRRGIDTHELAMAVQVNPEIVTDIIALMESHRVSQEVEG